MQLTANKPGFWSVPMTGRGILKARGVLVAMFAFATCALWTAATLSTKPPKENKQIENFQDHRAAYERIREMLLADRSVRAVYTRFGVETGDSGLPHKPGELSFPVSRYNDYVALLKQVGSNAAFRSEGDHPELVCVGAWGAGWAGNTRHVWICSADRKPANEVRSLDDYYRNPQRQRNAFRRIEGDWYLRADW